MLSSIIVGLFWGVIFLVFSAVVVACWILLIWAFVDLILRKEENSEIRAAWKKRKENNNN